MKKHLPKKKFSQNFLNDKNILKKIASVVDLNGKNVIEIGPGQGALTSFLIEKAKKVYAFEIDKDLIDFLNEKFHQSKNIEIKNEDFLKSNLDNYKDFYIVANIPYNISTQIIFKIFDNYQNFSNVVLLVQKEFAQRLYAKPNSKDYSKLSVSTKLFYDVKYCFDVDPKFFYPQPKVVSSVVHLKRTDKKYDLDYYDFLDFVKICFSMRRKTLWNNIKHLGIEQDEYKKICDKLNVNYLVRPENLEFEQFIFIYKKISK